VGGEGTNLGFAVTDIERNIDVKKGDRSLLGDLRRR